MRAGSSPLYSPSLQRLAIDPNSHNILYFGARSGKGLWKSTDYGASWTQVKNFPSVGEFVAESFHEHWS